MQLHIEPVTSDTAPILADLLAEYQAFYQADINTKRNIDFVASFVDSSDGVFLLGRSEHIFVGFVGIYFSYSSVAAKRIAVLNDVYIQSNFRGYGFGKQLIDSAINYIKAHSIEHVRWCTKADNDVAQRLYASFPASKSDWLHYDMAIV